MIVHIENVSGERAPRQFLTRWLELLARELRVRKVRKPGPRDELTVALVSAAHMRKLNRQFRERDYATDVLSFAADEGHGMGELAICPQVLQRQAREHGLSYREELGYMVIHGVLHLLGFDHERTEREARRMFTLQDQLFESLCESIRPGTKRRSPRR